MKEGFTDIYVIVTAQKKMGRRLNLQTPGHKGLTQSLK